MSLLGFVPIAPMYSFGGLRGAGTLTGSAFVVGGDVTFNQNVTLGPSSVGGNINAGGNINLTFANIAGNVTAGGTYSSGGSSVGGNVAFGPGASPATFTPVTMPAQHTFSSGGLAINDSAAAQTVTLAPGSYGNVYLARGTSVLNLSAGDYFFERLFFSGNLNLDTSQGPIHVFSTTTLGLLATELTLNGLPFNSISPASASQVYWESHGALDLFGKALGTFYAPNSDAQFSNGTLKGSLYSGHDVRVLTVNSTFIFGSVSPELMVVPEPSSLVLAGMGLLGLTAWRLRRRESHARSSSGS